MKCSQQAFDDARAIFETADDDHKFGLLYFIVGMLASWRNGQGANLTIGEVLVDLDGQQHESN